MRRTQRAIKQVLTERYYSWQEAEKLAREDPEIDFSGNVPLYTSEDFIEEETEEVAEGELAVDEGQERQTIAALEAREKDLPLEPETKKEDATLQPEVKQEQRPSSNA